MDTTPALLSKTSGLAAELVHHKDLLPHVKEARLDDDGGVAGVGLCARHKVHSLTHRLARALQVPQRRLAGGTVGLLIPKAAHLHVDVFLAQLGACVHGICQEVGLDLLIETTDDLGAEPVACLDRLRSRGIGGLIVVNPRGEDYGLLHRLADAGVALVVFGAGLPGLERFAALGCDSPGAVRLLMRHLQQLGHRRIGHVSYAPAEFVLVDERVRGWTEALLADGVRPEPAWLVHADISAASGYQATRSLLAQQRPLPAARRITALFAGNDTIAFGALRAVREAGLQVPSDIAVVGFDDIPLAAYADPPLTTVRTDPIGHGREAMALLLAQLRGLRAPPTHWLERPELVVRASCGAVRG
ncbi:periplasmic binding protein/LacI transcriptional regulator [Leptothrix cholodnii SP-6]|uniref:Periplasmic binding protein/LacI transcriptional regulator n=1 Tax=Leptothrix cholodnii (strain ATCC 51168 / LMG 8142 / SP-6) TaxID=395495 RepID=B1Y1N4_LEPCP|nr:substrate-binding domain-containing protein [Leptothrix cholodnii]ACB35496.1 periplasmic binding protein/LacI transcriptional regulator [Leptothrix cholodnii SP-6]